MRNSGTTLGFAGLISMLAVPTLMAACSGSSLSMGDSTGGSAGSSASGASNASGGSSASGGSAASAGSSASGGNDAAGGDASAGTGSNIGGTGAGGTSSGIGGSSNAKCGGSTCAADQICCGPAECGHCISKLSGQACPAVCQGAGGSGGTGNGGGGSPNSPDCAQLLDTVNKKQAEAQMCVPGKASECQGSLEGVCCPIGVESASADNAKNAAYLSALKAYKASCTQNCPAIACIAPEAGDCRVLSSLTGKCGP